MAMQYFLILSVLIIGYSTTASQIYKRPQIQSEFETIIDAHGNHTIFCQGNKPLKWTTPKVEEEKRSWTTFVVEPKKPSSPDFRYGSRLRIYNMSYPFVGFYYCHHEDVDETDENESNNIYLYVNDNEHLTILEGGDYVETVLVTQYQEAIIPCKPTAPDVHVELSLLTGEEVEDTNYDPKTGFSFFVSDLSQEQTYICTFTRNSENSESIDIFVHLAIDTLPVSHLAKPDLKDKSGGHTVVGDPLTLECIIKTTNSIRFHWRTPNGPINRSRMNTSDQRAIESGKILQTLTVYNTTTRDKGVYICNVTDSQSHSSFAGLDVKIYDLDEYYLNMSETNNLYSIVASAGKQSIQWSIDVQGHPEPMVTWLNNANDTIPMGNGNKYEADFSGRTNVAFLKIKNIAITDLGYYKLLGSNNRTEKMLRLFLNVTDSPSVRIETDPFHLINGPGTVKCFAYANPEPEFQWRYKACQTEDCHFLPINGTVIKRDSFEFISEVTVNASETGYVKCSASNYKGSDEAVTGFYVSDISDGFNILDLDSTVLLNEEKDIATVALGDTITATCGASVYNYTDINWFFKNQILQNDDRYRITKSYTQYSNKLQLEIPQANFSDSGMYSCRVIDPDGKYLFKNLSFYTATPQAPMITHTNMKEEMEMNLPDQLQLICEVIGIPKPTVTWWKDGVLFEPSEPKRIKVRGNNEKIIFTRTDAKDEGTYKCEVRNKMGSVFKQQSVKFKNLPRPQKWLLFVITFLSILSVGAIIFIFIKIRKEKQLQRELKKLGLANFEKGAVENINPELGIDDQAELLPYNPKWEFPIDSLKLGKQLGSGAFGVVMKGEAKNIVEGEAVTTVAVKMVKKNADYTYIRALASELKIMVHLGKHLNVVNLLGACTKNVAKRELLVIVEYCRFGNLQNYLLRHRDNYIDQVDPKSGKVDYTIGQEQFDRTYSVSSDRSNAQSPSLKYAALTFSNSGSHPILPPPNSMGDYRANANTGVTVNTDMTTITQDDGVILSNNSVQPEWRSNYKGDYKGTVKPICTKDLLAWAFQVARGMEYLASRKVLHGDLAARNILLADNNVVKICDFGLAKSMYKNDNYKKRGDGPLPVKWMAIESIRDRVFSTQSDVWSFGIVLWEFFSLAKTPYPGMEADERLYHKLVDGYRMESPDYAPAEIYKMMTDCWAPKPLTRPSFTKLSEKIGTLLEDSLRKHYIDLNDPYLVMNTQRLEDGESDYLAMLSPPTFEALSTPHYVNENVVQESLEDSGYLSMKPNAVFSPRIEEEGQVFDFNINNRKHLNSVDENEQELLPMLRRPSDSDCETPVQIPTSPNSFSNPTYHIPPKILEETGDSVNNNTDIVKSVDNYVNMPQNKSFVKEKTNPSNNPFVNVDNTKGDVHYVNSNSRDWESIQV